MPASDDRIEDYRKQNHICTSRHSPFAADLFNKYLKHGLQNGNMACHGSHMQRGGASRSRHI